MKNEFKTIRHIWTVVCERALIDPITNSASLSNVYEEIQLSGKDALAKPGVIKNGEIIPLNYQIVSLWKRLEKGDREVVVDGQIEIIDPVGKSLLKAPHQIKIEQGKLRARWILQFNAFQITVPGEYVFKLSAKERTGKDFVEVAENYLMVSFIPQLNLSGSGRS